MVPPPLAAYTLEVVQATGVGTKNQAAEKGGTLNFIWLYSFH